MKVILKERVKTLGNVGEIVNVSAGHARNFLIPNGFAVLADASNKAQSAHFEKILSKKVGEQKTAAQATAKAVGAVELELIKRSGPTGKLFGSVTTQDLSEELAKLGHDIERRHLILAKPIRDLGVFTVAVKVFSGVESSFKVTVKMDPKQAEENVKRAEEQAALKAAQALEAAAKAEAGESAEGTELSEEDKLKQEANAILRM